MPHVLIHAPGPLDPESRSRLVREVRESIPPLLNTPEHLGQVMLYEAPPEARANHQSRGARFVMAHVVMYPGRTLETKRAFLANLIGLIARHTGAAPEDVECTVFEVAPENWLNGAAPPEGVRIPRKG